MPFLRGHICCCLCQGKNEDPHHVLTSLGKLPRLKASQLHQMRAFVEGLALESRDLGFTSNVNCYIVTLCVELAPEFKYLRFLFHWEPEKLLWNQPGEPRD